MAQSHFNPDPDRWRAVYLMSVHSEARERGREWLASVLRPTGKPAIEALTTQQLKAILDVWFVGKLPRRQGVRSI